MRFLHVALLALLAAWLPSPVAARAAAQDPADADMLDRYRIGPDDVLLIDVEGLAGGPIVARVDKDGAIEVPGAGRIAVQCRTPLRLAVAISGALTKNGKAPEVDVQVTQARNHWVGIIGAVDRPGRFPLTRGLTLVQLLVLAGGPSNLAGSEISILNEDSADLCEDAIVSKTGNADRPTGTMVGVIRLEDLLAPGSKTNYVLRSGDVVFVPWVEVVRVMDGVMRPRTSVPIGRGLTLSEAVALAGGPCPGAEDRPFYVLRGGDPRRRMQFSLRDIRSGASSDPVLEANDVVFGPGNCFPAGMRSVPGLPLVDPPPRDRRRPTSDLGRSSTR